MDGGFVWPVGEMCLVGGQNKVGNFPIGRSALNSGWRKATSNTSLTIHPIT